MKRIGKCAERITKIRPFIKKYKFEKNNIAIALNVLYAKKEKNISCLCFKK